jgi:hypothetical protein
MRSKGKEGMAWIVHVGVDAIIVFCCEKFRLKLLVFLMCVGGGLLPVFIDSGNSWNRLLQTKRGEYACVLSNKFHTPKSVYATINFSVTAVYLFLSLITERTRPYPQQTAHVTSLWLYLKCRAASTNM